MNDVLAASQIEDIAEVPPRNVLSLHGSAVPEIAMCAASSNSTTVNVKPGRACSIQRRAVTAPAAASPAKGHCRRACPVHNPEDLHLSAAAQTACRAGTLDDRTSGLHTLSTSV